MSALLAHPRTIAAPFRAGFRPVHHNVNRTWLPPLVDGSLLAQPSYPDIDLTQRGSPQHLDQLRPPHQEYVAKPLPDNKGTISLARWISYWYRLSKSRQRFYKEGLRKAWYNKKEADHISARIPFPGNSALFGGAKLASGEVIPAITRREFQLLHRAPSDFAKLFPLGFIVYGFGILAPFIIKFLPKSLLPGTCLQKHDQFKLFSAWQARHQRMGKESWKFFAPTDPTPARRDYWLHQLFWHAYVVSSHPLSFLHPFVPHQLRTNPEHPFSYFRIYYPHGQDDELWTYPVLSWLRRSVKRYHDHNLQDTALIMREGGFGKLGPLDIYEYCTRTGSQAFSIYCSANAISSEELPTSRAMVKHMAPILDNYAQYLFSQDWSRLKSEHRSFIEAMTRVWDHRIPGSFGH